MRKIYTLIAALCCTVAAQAVDYTIKFAVNGTVKFSVKLSEGASANTVREYGETMRGQVVLPDYYTFRKWDQEFAEVTQNVTYNALYIMKDGVLYYQVDEPTETAFVTYEVLYDNNYKNLTGSVTIPASIRDNSMEFQVTGVGDHAFYGCSGLTSVTIPNSVTSMGDGAFYRCSGLTTITCKAVNPPTCGVDAFKNVNKAIPLNVPYGCKPAYEKAARWSEFTNIVEMTPTSLNQIDSKHSTLNTKRLIDGQLFILRDGKTYTVQGQEIK